MIIKKVFTVLNGTAVSDTIYFMPINQRRLAVEEPVGGFFILGS